VRTPTSSTHISRKLDRNFENFVYKLFPKRPGHFQRTDRRAAAATQPGNDRFHSLEAEGSNAFNARSQLKAILRISTNRVRIMAGPTITLMQLLPW